MTDENGLGYEYLAGLIDGEGCIAIQRRRTDSGSYSYELTLRIALTDRGLLQKVKAALGGRISPHTRGERRGNRQDIWLWRADGRGGAHALELVGPFLEGKKKQAAVALSFAALRHSFGSGFGIRIPATLRHRFDEHYLLMRRLNEVGSASRRYEIELPDWVNANGGLGQQGKLSL
jgi:hypothetical protein